MGTKNILSVPNVRNRNHPTAKPVELMQILIENSTEKGDTVLDPFVGGGATIIACMQSGRNFIGYEIDKEYFDRATERIEAVQAQIRMEI